MYFFAAAIFERLRTILHEGEIDKRVQYMVEVMFAVRKDGFKVRYSGLRNSQAPPGSALVDGRVFPEGCVWHPPTIMLALLYR